MSQDMDKAALLLMQAEEIQKAASEAIESLKVKIPSVVGAEVERALKTMLGPLEAASRETAQKLQVASKAAVVEAETAGKAFAGLQQQGKSDAFWKSVCTIVLVALVASVAPLGIVWWEKSTLDDLKAEIVRQQATVEMLTAKYGKAEFSTCDNRPCIRVDERSNVYTSTDGRNKKYRVIFGY